MTTAFLAAMVGCKSAIPNRTVQAELQPAESTVATTSNTGIFSSIINRMKASPNDNRYPTTKPAAARMRSGRQPSSNDDLLQPDSRESASYSDREADLDDTGLIDAFSDADPEVRAVAQRQFAAMQNIQQQGDMPDEISDLAQAESALPNSSPASRMSLPKPGQKSMVAQVAAKPSNRSDDAENPVQQAAATRSENDTTQSVALATNRQSDSATNEVEAISTESPSRLQASRRRRRSNLNQHLSKRSPNLRLIRKHRCWP
ncbi:MAG: hypothetical protein R3C05_24170 [Pirellulaceae bacterium]